MRRSDREYSVEERQVNDRYSDAPKYLLPPRFQTFSFSPTAALFNRDEASLRSRNASRHYSEHAYNIYYLLGDFS